MVPRKGARAAKSKLRQGRKKARVLIYSLMMDAAISAIVAVMYLMVDDPSSLVREVVRQDEALTIKVSAKDVRQLIGRQGRNALSLRTLLNAWFAGMENELS